MNLDDLGAFRELDSQGMLAQINALPRQLEAAYEHGAALPLPECSSVERVLITGIGGAAAGADLLAAWAADCMPLPIILHTEINLPLWARGPRTLVVAISNSGETNETLGVVEQAVDVGCPALALTTGGRLADLARLSGFPAWVYPHRQVSSAAVGWTFGLLHSALFRLGWLPDPQRDLAAGLHAMYNAQMNLLAEVPVVKNPAKRLAGQMVGRWVAVFSAGCLAPVARRWKTQLNRLAKTWAQVELLPEARHHAFEGLANPARPLNSLMALFLRSPGLDVRSLRGLESARLFAMQQGINTDVLEARGQSRFDHLWTSLLFADYTAFFLAMAYGVDPSPTAALDYLNTGAGVSFETHHRID
jgi:glucose/mannose-6-phosphate isomerase